MNSSCYSLLSCKICCGEYLLIQKKRLEIAAKESPGEKAYLDKYLKNINDYLAKPDAELGKPAICSWNEEERFEKFVEEGTYGSFIAIKPNLAYYHKKLPLSTTQFFLLLSIRSHMEILYLKRISPTYKRPSILPH